MKPESVDDGSLEKLAEKAAWTIRTWDEGWAKDHEARGQDEVWDIYEGKTQIASHLTKKICRKLVAHHKKSILSALSEATAALEEKIKEAQKEASRAWGCDTSHVAQLAIVCGQRDDLQAQIKELESKTPTPVRHVSEAARDAFKEFVHRRLDRAGVPKEFPHGKHTEEGCRIGDRLDWVFEEAEKAKAESDRLRQVLGDKQPRTWLEKKN